MSMVWYSLDVLYVTKKKKKKKKTFKNIVFSKRMCQKKRLKVHTRGDKDIQLTMFLFLLRTQVTPCLSLGMHSGAKLRTSVPLGST